MTNKNDILNERRHYEKKLNFKNELLSIIANENEEKIISINLINFITKDLFKEYNKISLGNKAEYLVEAKAELLKAIEAFI